MIAVIYGRTPVVQWLVKTGGASIYDVNIRGSSALAFAAMGCQFSILQWLLEEGLANIADVIILSGKARSVWDNLSKNMIIKGEPVALTSLLKVMVLLGDAPLDCIAKLSPHNAEIATQGRQIRALRPVYLEQQQASIDTQRNLPAVLQSIVATYAEPTPDEMWTEWVRWV
jgi:hypothetical protein